MISEVCDGNLAVRQCMVKMADMDDSLTTKPALSTICAEIDD